MRALFQRIYIGLQILRCKAEDSTPSVFRGARWSRVGGFLLSLRLPRPLRKRTPSLSSV